MCTMYVPEFIETIKGLHQIPIIKVTEDCELVWVLRMEPKSSARTASAFNFGVTTAAQNETEYPHIVKHIYLFFFYGSEYCAACL